MCFVGHFEGTFSGKHVLAGVVRKEMLVVLLCCMLKIAEMSTGRTLTGPGKKKTRKRGLRRRRAKGMSEIGLTVRGAVLTPDSDCNSNRPDSASCLSNTSSQDFVQDNSDYQWFLDYGYRDGGINHHTSILSLSETYETGDARYYDVLSKNMDANLAEVDIESFRTEDIHTLLTTLPPMCTDHSSQESNRQGESFASVSGSIMSKFDLDGSLDSPRSSSKADDSQNSNSMSICKSELLFSPVKETPMPGVNFSIDSLDCDLLTEQDIMLTCQANKDNYTIAFEGSMTMYSEESDYQETDKSEASGSTQWKSDLKTQISSMKALEKSMSRSDSGSFTTWSKLKKRCSDNQLRRHPSGNNNSNTESYNNLTDHGVKSQSMPNLHKQKVKLTGSFGIKSQNDSSGSMMGVCAVRRVPVKVFDIQHQVQSSSGSGGSLVSDMATSLDGGSSLSETGSNIPNFSLVKLFMKQKSLSAEGMSTGLDQSSASENWRSQSGESNNSDHRLENSRHIENDHKIKEKIIEEPEEASSSESVEQLSESISKLDSVYSENNYKVTNNINNNNNFGNGMITQKLSKLSKTCIPVHLINRSMQTSQFPELCSLKNPTYKLNSNKTKENIKVIEPSFLNILKNEGQLQPVYILYPNYVLPDLDFLNNKDDNPAKVFLLPQNVQSSNVNKKRPFSCNDLEALKKKGFGHIKDWDSLNFLLPCEYRQILSDIPELKPSNTPSYRQKKCRPSSCDLNSMERTNSIDRVTNSSSSQPSSGYRGSSTTLLTDSQNSPAPTATLNPLFVYKYDSVTSSEASLMSSERQRSITTMAPPLPKRSNSLSNEKSPRINDPSPPRPPLPKGILRRNLDSTPRVRKDPKHRYSVLLRNEDDFQDESNAQQKRHSTQEPYYLRNKRASETEDEGVDAGTSSSSLEDNVTPMKLNPNFLSHMSAEELLQLEEFLKLSGISKSDDEELDEDGLVQLRSYVSNFLALKINQEPGKKNVSFAESCGRNLEHRLFTAPNNSPNVSAFVTQRNYQSKTLVDMPICEESEGSPENCASPQRQPKQPDLTHKRTLISAVTIAVEKLIQHFSPATNQAELIALGDSTVNPACAKLALSGLCPALYAVLSDGLKPALQSSFGDLPNSVWQVVEASAQQGPLTKALNELVMKINAEDVITEGLVKFNAFVFGLLNVRSLDAWTSYLKTRETVLRKHYTSDSLLLSHTTDASVRSLLDTLIATLQPLALLPFQFDLLFEYRQLHLSLKRMDEYQQPTSPKNHSTQNVWTFDSTKHCKSRSYEQRPRSCLEMIKPTFKLGEDVNKKRWSGISLSSKLYQVYDRLAREEDEEYTDSLEVTLAEDKPKSSPSDGPESMDSNVDEKPINGRRFKKLQKKWEMLSGKETSHETQSPPPMSPTHTKSRIPRPLSSPVKPSGIPVMKKVVLAKNALVKDGAVKKSGVATCARTSRLDQMEAETQRHPTRPSSLPYKPSSQSRPSKITPPRRAVSSSLNRRAQSGPTQKVVRTITHKLPSESGHLSYSEGERLRVVLEVDDKWLLCCRGSQKGLVLRSAVVAEGERF